MGQTKLEKSGLYFVATDVDSGEFAFEPQPTKDIRYVIEKETIKFFNKDNKRYGTNDGYLIGLTGTVDLTAGASGSVDGITVGGVEIMSGVENFDTSLTVTAANVAANITAFTSVPNYTATSAIGLITIKIATDKVAVDGLTVTSATTTITSVDVDMGVDTGNIIDSTDTEFVDLATLVIFLRASTGG